MKIPALFSIFQKRIPTLVLISLAGFTLSSVGLLADEETHFESEPDCPESALIILRNGDLELGILPKVGGSAVLFRKVGGENVLFAPCEHWADWEPHLPDPLDLSEWTAFQGHIIWLSPQVDFWNQQDLIPSQHDQLWPPDPYWVYGDFKVVEQSEHHLLLEGPPSPYSGIKMIKRYQLDQNGAHLTVTGINITDRVLHWGLWSNTRVYGNTRVFVPVSGKDRDSFRIEAPQDQGIPYTVESGYFSFAPGVEDKANIYSKAYLFPNANWMAGFRNHQAFVKVMQDVDPHAVHEKQAVFEVYKLRPNKATNDPGLTEMEAHGPYLELKPGDEMTLSERWMIFDLDEELEKDESIRPVEWLKRHREMLDGIEVE